MRNNGNQRIWTVPVLLALPFAAAMGYAAVRYGRTVQNLIHTAIKLVVTR